MEQQLPAWLTKEYLQDKLRVFFMDDALTLLEMTVEPASGKGQNWIGIMTRIYAKFEVKDGQTQRQSFILKQTCPTDAVEAKVFKEYGVYTREMYMYETVLPAMSKVLREMGIEGKLHAEGVSIDYTNTSLIMEDLAALGYRGVCRIDRLDVPHIHLILDMLAKYHAAAAIVGEQQPNLFKKNFESSFFTRGFKGYSEVFQILFKSLMRYVKSQPKLKELYYKKMEKVLPNLMEYTARSFDVGPTDFQTLSHGDCWTTNIMFRYNKSGQPIDVVPIDFQFSSWTSPITDLQYLFSTSLCDGLEDRHMELSQYYYYSLRNALNEVKYHGYIPTLHEFQVDFKRRRFIAVPITLLFQPLMLYNGQESPCFENLYSENEEAFRFQDSCYKDKKIQQIVERVLPIFDAEGLFDEM